MSVSADVSPRWRLLPVTVLILVTSALSGTTAGSTVRSIDGNAALLWAAGDNGLLLTSTDAGRTWKPFKTPAPAHWQQVVTDGSDVLLFGGLGRPGHPEGFGMAAVYRKKAGEEAFVSLPRRPEGWAYGGEFAGDFVAVFGQASAGSPSGLTRTATAGKLWTPIGTATQGYLLGGGFRSWRYGYAVGGGHRVVSLRALKEPQLHPAEVASSLTLRGGAFVDGNEFWTVGDNATLLRSQQDAAPWSPIPAKIPAAARSLADFETVASDGAGKAWIAGGQVGFVLHTPDGGRSWKRLPAPAPGGIRTMHRLSDGTLLAGGDGGRVWRSEDDGDSWKRVHGRAETDVLFVLSATDVGSWPAIVAHALAGCNVGVVFVTTPTAGEWIPPSQNLRAAALEAGASSVTVLNDFRSHVLDGQIDADANEMLAAWSLKLDTDAAKEIRKQIAATIRLHRPTVLAMGPSGSGLSGAAGEARLIARMTKDALELAGNADAPPLKGTGLEAWKPKRIFQGDGGNDVWVAPWEKNAPQPTDDATTYVNVTAFPAGANTSLEMLTQAALWRMPWMNLLDRPARVSAWHARHTRVFNGRRPLFTSALTTHRLAFTAADRQRRSLSSMAYLRMAALMGRTGGAMTHLSPAAIKAKSDPLAADRLLLAWHRLLSEGDLERARQARDLLLKHGRNHPLYEKAVLMTVATATSAEWRPHFRHYAPSGATDPLKVSKAMTMLAARGAWWDTAGERVLLASALVSGGQDPKAREVLKSVAGGPFDGQWRRYAAERIGAETVGLGGQAQRQLVALPMAGPGKLDGKLDEPYWGKATPATLSAGKDANPLGRKAAVRFLRSPTHLLVGAHLSRGDQTQWDLHIAVDADRDATTAWEMRCDTSGERTVELISRHGLRASLDSKTVQVQARRQADAYTFEVAIPLSALGVNVRQHGQWNVQVRAESWDQGREAVLRLAPAPGGRYEMHHWALLKSMAATRERNAE